MEDIRARPEIISLEIVESSEGRVVGSVAMRELWIIWTIVDCGCFLEYVVQRGREGGLQGAVRQRGSLPNLIKAISSRGVDIEINRIARTVDRPVITRKQEKVLRLALEEVSSTIPGR